MIISLQTERKTITLNVESSYTIKKVKEIIQDLNGVVPISQRIILDGKVLNERKTLFECNIKDKSILKLEFSLGGFKDRDLEILQFKEEIEKENLENMENYIYLINFKSFDFCFHIGGRDYNEWTALHYAASIGKEKSINLLLTMGADETIKDLRGQTAKDIAQQFDYKLGKLFE